VLKTRSPRSGRTFRAERAGQAMVELALALPVLVFGIVGGIDFGRVYAAYFGAMNAARAGVEAGVMGAAQTDAAIIAQAQDELQRVPALDLANATITVTHTTSGGVSYTNVRVQYTFHTIVAWPYLPATAQIDRTASYRIYP